VGVHILFYYVAWRIVALADLAPLYFYLEKLAFSPPFLALSK